MKELVELTANAFSLFNIQAKEAACRPGIPEVGSGMCATHTRYGAPRPTEASCTQSSATFSGR
jgi:hypothetical protein